MKFSSIYRRAVWALIFLALPVMVRAAAKPVMVHYMPWFQSQLYAPSGTWGNHWRMTNFDPNTFTNGKRNIASWYYPLIGPYDSLDDKVLEYHVLLMKLGGVDGVIADWYGQEAYNDYGLINTRTAALFNWTRKAGLKFAMCYESRSVQAKVNGGNIAASNAIANAQQTMLYLQTNYFSEASYLRVSNQPVLLGFGTPTIYFTLSSQWTNIFSVLHATNQPAFYSENYRQSPAAAGGYNWMPLSGSGTTTSVSLATVRLNDFNNQAITWPSYIGGAYPRYRDIYAQAGGASNGYLDDANGLIFTNSLRWAMTNKSALIQIATWNDFGEGTVIEPTVEYGYRDLSIVQHLRRQHLDATFTNTINDLAQATRFYNLRTNYNNYPAIAAELNRVFTNLCTGQLALARLQMTGIESNTPVIYNLSSSSNQIQFNIGGYLAGGAQVQMATNLTSPVWQTVRTYAPGTTALITFSTNANQHTRSFFKVQ